MVAECPVCHNASGFFWPGVTLPYLGPCLNCRKRGRPDVEMILVNRPTDRNVTQEPGGQQRLFIAEHYA